VTNAAPLLVKFRILLTKPIFNLARWISPKCTVRYVPREPSWVDSQGFPCEAPSRVDEQPEPFGVKEPNEATT
jgi:hypothetical protein